MCAQHNLNIIGNHKMAKPKLLSFRYELPLLTKNLSGSGEQENMRKRQEDRLR